jgi:SIR2-like domain
MSQPALTVETAFKALKDFFREKPFLFFGSGMSLALDPRLGMGALGDTLCEQIARLHLNPEQGKEWGQVDAAIKSGQGLEAALDHVSNGTLLEAVTRITGEFVAKIDHQCALRIANDGVVWPATSLIKRIVDTLPEGDRTLHALTPNYDMLFEYACDSARIPYTTGFSGGVERRLDWSAAERSMLLPEQASYRRRLKWIFKPRKHIRLYKVHGSLNFFFHRGELLENNAWLWNAPDYAQRVLITPGLSKYEKIQSHRQELLKFADAAIDRADRFLFLGYGFNDKHLEEYIRRKLIGQKCVGLGITRSASQSLKNLMQAASRLWVVCDLDDGTGTRILNNEYSAALDLPGRALWKVSEFTDEILGG